MWRVILTAIFMVASWGLWCIYPSDLTSGISIICTIMGFLLGAIFLTIHNKERDAARLENYPFCVGDPPRNKNCKYCGKPHNKWRL